MVNFADFSRLVENRAVQKALETLPNEMRLQERIAATGTVLNLVESNQPVGNETPLLLRCDGTTLGAGVLSS